MWLILIWKVSGWGEKVTVAYQIIYHSLIILYEKKSRSTFLLIHVCYLLFFVFSLDRFCKTWAKNKSKNCIKTNLYEGISLSSLPWLPNEQEKHTFNPFYSIEFWILLLFLDSKYFSVSAAHININLINIQRTLIAVERFALVEGQCVTKIVHIIHAQRKTYNVGQLYFIQ